MMETIKQFQTLLYSSALILLISGESFSQKKVGFNGQQIEMAELKSSDKAPIPTKAFAGKKLVIVEGNPDAFGKGLALGNNRFLISIPAEAGAEELFGAGIKSWAPVTAASKIAPDLRTKISNPNLAALDIYVVCIPGMNEKQIRAAWQNSWGQIKEVWNDDNMMRIRVTANSGQINAISKEGWSMQLEEAEGEIIHHNQTAADNGRINTIAGSGFGWSTGLTGKGVSVGIGDGGLVEYHADLESHQFNLISTKLSSFGDHQDHVSGTIGGLGLINPANKGMAPEARILNHQTSNIISNAVSLRTKQNVTLTNNSYGNTFACTRSGLYNSTASMMDGQTVSYPDLLHVVSAGNAGTSLCSPYPSGFFNLSDGYPVAKNCLTVGQVNASDVVNNNSCKGPSKDGRLKPEIVVNGELNSTVPFDSYGFKSGTSQSAPVLTGTLALLTERYKQLVNQNPEAALLKALVCNTADDIGLANVDFSSGFGRLNARKARRALENAQYSSNTITSNSIQNFNLTVPAGATSLKVMLAWTDPAAAASPVKALINDLNISVLRSNGTVTLPWVPNPAVATVNQAAVRGTDSLNNLEQVSLSVTPGEILTIRTSSKTISGSSQKYWIVYDWVRPELVLTAPLQNQIMKTATAFSFRWDLSNYTFSSFVLETSNDSVTWSTAQTIANSTALVSSFTPSGTSFRKGWFRYRGVSSGQNIYSNAVKVIMSPQPAPTATICDRSVRLSWTSISGATRYEIFRLNRSAGIWESRGSTTGLVYYFGGLTNGTKEFFAVRPWFGNEGGLRSNGVSATPAAGTCAWTKDLGISRLISPVSGRLATSSAPSSIIQLELQNFSNTSVSAQSCTLNYRRPDGIVQQFPLSLSMGAGIKQNYTVPVSFNNTGSGTQRLRFWLSTAGDINTSNDSLQTDIKVLANNPERTFPLSLNFESLPVIRQNSGSTGIPGEDRIDFFSTNQARILSTIKTPPASFGTRSLVLDKEKLDSRTGTGEVVITLNLSSFPSPKELKLSFDFLSFGSALTTGNAISFRPSDQASWITIRNFAQESFIAGNPKSYTGIDLLPLLAGASPTSSFQIRLTFSGQRSSEIETLGGYAIDNIIITLPSTDVKATALTFPPEDCYTENENRPVKLEIQNTSQQAVQKVLLAYQVKGSEAVIDTLQSLGAGETTTFTFSKNLGANQFGKMDIRAWVNSPGDANAANDSLAYQPLVHYKLVNQFPSYESFESTAGSWVAYTNGNSNRWEWGSGLGKLTAIDTAANGSKFWFSNPASNLNSENISYLQSPCFDASRMSDFQISFHSAFSLSGENEQAWIEVSQDGQTWTKAGSSGAGMNWYNESGDLWANRRFAWQASGLKFPQGSLAVKNRIRFRIALMQSQGSNGQGFAMDDFHIEPSSDVDIANSLDQTQSGSVPGSWLTFGKDGNRAAMIQNDASLTAYNLQMNLNQDGIRSFTDRYYLDRNFLLMPQSVPSSTQKIRLFIALSEVEKLKEKDLDLKGFQQLGVFRYHGPNRDFSPDNNDFSAGNDVSFLSGGSILKVPTFGGHYLELETFGFSEFYICRRSLVDNTASGLRVASMDFPNHQPVEIKWLTPLDEYAGRQLDRKIAWMEPATESLFLEGLNGNTARIRLIGLKGQILLDQEFTGYKFETRTSGIPKGVYTLRVEQESGAETFRLVLD